MSGPGALCVGPRRSPGALPALSVSGPDALCAGPRRSLCRGPALSVSGPGALCVEPRRSLCVGARRSLCRGPALSVSGSAALSLFVSRSVSLSALCVGARHSLCQAPALSVSRPDTEPVTEFPATESAGRAPRHRQRRGPKQRAPGPDREPDTDPDIEIERAPGPDTESAGPRHRPDTDSAGPRRSRASDQNVHPIRVPPPIACQCIWCRPPAPIPSLHLACHIRSAGPQFRSACHPSTQARSLFPGENPKPYCLGENKCGSCLKAQASRVFRGINWVLDSGSLKTKASNPNPNLQTPSRDLQKCSCGGMLPTSYYMFLCMGIARGSRVVSVRMIVYHHSEPSRRLLPQQKRETHLIFMEPGSDIFPMPHEAGRHYGWRLLRRGLGSIVVRIFSFSMVKSFDVDGFRG